MPKITKTKKKVSKTKQKTVTKPKTVSKPKVTLVSKSKGVSKGPIKISKNYIPKLFGALFTYILSTTISTSKPRLTPK